MALSNEDFRKTLGDHVRELCELVDVPVPEDVITVHLSVDGLEIEYADRAAAGFVTRTVHRRGPINFRPLFDNLDE
ncbi:hypothetical protein [Rhodococcus sp. JT-3]|uniref:hypothetical protein n=1 Tax=Rhodococcus sp. JT-3 TaxID=1973213 RepID=UPI001303C61A|nr:hypothetical protein [Rhodococcus sp. JT-3]